MMKNALDWVVRCEALVQKPVAVLNASPRATHADVALKETLSVM
jgi:NAD(P)H-dependent FMN reductase